MCRASPPLLSPHAAAFASLRVCRHARTVGQLPPAHTRAQQIKRMGTNGSAVSCAFVRALVVQTKTIGGTSRAFRSAPRMAAAEASSAEAASPARVARERGESAAASPAAAARPGGEGAEDLPPPLAPGTPPGGASAPQAQAALLAAAPASSACSSAEGASRGEAQAPAAGPVASPSQLSRQDALALADATHTAEELRRQLGRIEDVLAAQARASKRLRETVFRCSNAHNRRSHGTNSRALALRVRRRAATAAAARCRRVARDGWWSARTQRCGRSAPGRRRRRRGCVPSWML
jgi:hypothetical protein